jgi:predicted nuclease of predicted toxin-antitoxin system
LRVFLDECCPPSLASALRALGHDVHHALERDRGLSDESQAVAAFRAGRVVISADYDFGDMAVRDGVRFVGLVLLAPDLGDISRVAEAIAQRLHPLMTAATDRILIVSAERVRERPLPPVI